MLYAMTIPTATMAYIVQRLRIYRINLRKDEDNGNEHGPEDGSDGNEE
jgi:hypothetical protein